MARIQRTGTSLADYRTIARYISRRDPTAAERMLERIDATLKRLAQTPHLGPSTEELGRNLRRFPVGNYLIFYEPIPNGVRVFRVIHAARDITAEFFQGT